MAPRSLIVKWRKQKAQRRTTQPRSFSTKGASTFYKHVKKTEAMFQAQQRVTGSVADAKERSERVAESAIKRFKYYVERLQPEHKILLFALRQQLEDVIRKDDPATDPRMSVEILKDRYARQDPLLAAFKFDVIRLESSDFHEKWMFFRGSECFLVFRREHEIFMSVMYRDPMFLKALPFKKVQWAGEPSIIPPSDSSA
jgi:hypothetical protein